MELIKINLKDLSKIFAPTPILKEILELYSIEDIDIQKLVDVFKKDPILSLMLIKLANSAYYGAPTQVTTLTKAIELIGLLETRNIALFHALVSQHKTYAFPEGFKYKDFWLHGLLTANISKELHSYLKSGLTKDEIYLCGLFHDIGWLIIAILHPDKYNQLLEYDNKLDSTAIPLHCRIGMLLSKLWNLPEPLTLTILYHERPQLTKKYIEEAIIINTSSNIAEKIKAYDNLPIEQLENMDFNVNLTELNIEKDVLNSKISKLLVYIQNLLSTLSI